MPSILARGPGSVSHGERSSGARLTIVVGITGGIAAYKAVQVVRDLVKRGHDVHVVPTEGALRFVGLPTLEALSRNPVTTSVLEDVAEVRHVALGRRADLVVIAPATADSLARMARGPGRRPARHDAARDRGTRGGRPRDAPADVGAPRDPCERRHAA